MSKPRITASDLQASVRETVTARETNLGIEIQTSVLYPDGHAVTVVVLQHLDEFEVHDASFGAMHFAGNGVRLNDATATRLSEMASDYGCKFIDSRMTRRCAAEQVSAAVIMVANASRLVGDYAYSVRRKTIRDFKREVTNAVSEVLGSDRIRNDEEVVGESGTQYKVNVIILDETKARPIAFVETIAEQNAVNGRFRAFYDIKLNDNISGIDRLSIYDDRHQWRAGDLLLLQNVSNPVPFTNIKPRLMKLAV